MIDTIDWLEWNGVRCTDPAYGMHVLQQPTITVPNQRLLTVNVPGRSGSLILTEAKDVYENLNISCNAVIDDPYMIVDGQNVSRIAKIAGWLRGHGLVKFANRPEGFYDAWVANQIPFETIVKGNPHRSFSVQFQAKPYFYLDSGTETTTYTSTTLITNLGNVPSAPLIKVYGSSEGSISFAGEDGVPSMVVEDFTGINYIMLDCDAKIAYKGAKDDPLDPLTLLGTRVSGDWLTIPTGTSALSISGGITSIELTPRWRCI